MKKRLHFLYLLLFTIPTISFGQMADGSIAPDWTHNDIFGNQHNLYGLLDEGKMVVVEFSATWCGPCWNYMLTGALENFWEQYGPDGTNQAEVFYIEADQSTDLDDLYGNTPESQGNWVANIPFPIIDLQVGENTDNDYQISYYPTLYAVCADHTIWEVGQVPAFEWAEFVESCTLASSVESLVQADCYGEGAIILETTGGVAPLEYEWSNGEDTPTLENIGAGTYSVTITDSNGKFIHLDDIVVTGEEEPIELASSEVENALCYESATGNITIQLQNGNAPFDYSWSNGASTQNLVNVTADEYTLNVTDDNGCTFEETFIITEPDPIEVESDFTPDYCDQNNGTIALSIDGGVGGYEVSASQGNVFGNLIQDLAAGDVVVEVEDNNGCVWSETYDVEYVAAPTMYFSPDPVLTCPEPIITVTGYVEDGSGDYEYAWTTADGNIVGPADGESIEVDEEGEYTLVIVDLFSGCEAENSIEVSSIMEELNASGGGDTPISCELPLVALDGSGEPTYVITWTTTNGNIVSGADTYAPVVNAPGEYTMTAYNPATACTLIDEVTVINEIDPATAAFTYQTSGLNMVANDQSSGSNVGGWQWTFGDGNSSSEQSVVHTFPTAGTYQVCLSVENACGANQLCQTVEVTFQGSVISVEGTVGHVLCNGNATGTIVLQVNGGSGIYTYTWTGPGGAVYNTPSLENVVAGAYQLVVSDDAGNVFIGEFIITEPSAVVLANSTLVDNPCHGQSNASITVDINGGVSPYSYALNGGASQAENIFPNLAAGGYEIIVTDANGCPFLAGPYTLIDPAALGHTEAVTNVRCYGESNGALAITVTGGTLPYSYLWNVNGATTPEVNGLPAGQYILQVTDSHGCNLPVSATVAQPDSVVALEAVTHASNTEQNNGSIILAIAGGTAPYLVTWNNGSTGDTLSGLLPGEYTYTIQDANGCIYNSAAPVVVAGVVATTDFTWAKQISIRPNPSNGNAIVRWNDLEVSHGYLTLATATGKQMIVKEITDRTGEWDLTDLQLAPGMYVVVAELNKQVAAFKIIIME
jgi:PKD repeat protein/thiol-disulfide isomerase/thioredoxin